MIKEFAQNLPEKVRNGMVGARQTFTVLQLQAEKRVRNVTAELRTLGGEMKANFANIRHMQLNNDDVKKRFTVLQEKAVKTFNANVEKAYGALNIPTRTEVEALTLKVNRINADIRKIVDMKSKSVKTAKPAAKKVASKKGKTAKKGKK
jgi:hypothetical protein